MIEYLKKRIVAAALSTASVIVVLQTVVLPVWLDFLTGMILIGLIWIVGQLAQEK